MPQLAQVFSQQCTKKHDGSSAVGQSVKNLNGNAPVVDEKAHQPAVLFLKIHGTARVCHIGPDKGPRRVIRLKIIPEEPHFDAGEKTGKARAQAIYCPLQRCGVHLFRHHGRKTVNRGILPALQCSIQHAGIVQCIPLFHLFRHGHAPFRISFLFYFTTSQSRLQ